MLFAHDVINSLTAPVLQYGAFGLCLVAFWIIRKQINVSAAQSAAVLQVLRETSDVIARNTATIEKVESSVTRHEDAAAKRHDAAVAAFEAMQSKVRAGLAEEAS